MSEPEERPAERMLASLTAGVVIGVIEVVLASSFAALIFGGTLSGRLADGVGLNLGAAALLLGVMAWTAGGRGVVGSLQDGPAAVLAVFAASGGVFMLLGVFRLGNLVRFAPYPVGGLPRRDRAGSWPRAASGSPPASLPACGVSTTSQARTPWCAGSPRSRSASSCWLSRARCEVRS